MKNNKKIPSDRNTFQNGISHDDIIEWPVKILQKNPCVLTITGWECRYLHRIL